MGVIQQQGIRNTLWSYAGVVLGVINLIFLYPFFFAPEQIGLIRIITSVALLYAHTASFGLNSIIIRYFPHFRSAEGTHHRGFARAVVLLAGTGFLIATVLFLLLKPYITAVYLDNSPLFVTYYTYLIPLTFFVFAFNIAESMLRSALQTVFTLFIREVLLRVLTTAGIVLVALEHISFEQFMLWFLVIHALIALIVIVYLGRGGWFGFGDHADMLNLRRLKIVLRYGLVSFLTGATTFVVQSIDALMLGAWLDLESVGVYTIAFFMGSVVAMPARGVMRIATPLIADAWKHNQRSRIMNIYRSTSFLQFTAGAGILTLIWLSLPALFGFLPPVYASGAWVVTFIGLGHLIDMTGGLNTNILATSRKYAMDLYFNAGFVVIIIVTNLALIPAFGLNGAAAASLISYLMVNVIRSVYLSRAFGMQPFHSGYLRVLGSILIPAGVVYAAQPFWTGLPLLVQILLNSAIFLALNAAALWLSGAFTLIRTHLSDMKNA